MAKSTFLLERIIPKPLRNRYILAGMVFFVWFLLFDKHDLFTQFRLHRSLVKLQEDKAAYQEKILEAKRESALLRENGEAIAREKYYMSKKGEDVFILMEE